MTRTLSARGQDILASMPPYYADDPAALSVVNVCANEVDRIESMLVAIQRAALPQWADDTYGLLSLWEYLVGLPVKPAQSVAGRQARVNASRRVKVATGADWWTALTNAIGTTSWTHTETPGIRVTLALPLESGSYYADTIISIARRLTPAHLDITTTYTLGFIVGISNLGDAL